MTTDFPNADEWEPTDNDFRRGEPFVKVGKYNMPESATYWRRKPQEPTYTLPSDEAKALYRKVFGHVAPKFSAATRYIDQALDAARQQGRDEYRVHNARGEDGPCECGPCRRTLWAIENSQGAGLGSQPDQRASQPSASSEGGSGGDGSTVASPLRGTGEICPGSKRPPPMAASKVVCPECGQTVTVHPRRLDWSGVNDLYIWPHNRPETGNQPDPIQVPEGKPPWL